MINGSLILTMNRRKTARKLLQKNNSREPNDYIGDWNGKNVSTKYPAQEIGYEGNHYLGNEAKLKGDQK